MWDKASQVLSPEKEKAFDEARHEQQLFLLKKQVKAIMEEAATKRFIHEESSHVLQFCATVEQCLLDSVKKRAAGFLRLNKLANLFSKVGKAYPDVKKLINLIEDAEVKLEKDLEPSFLYRSPFNSLTNNGGNGAGKHLWVRMALTAKLLDVIADYLVQNHSKFYHPSSIMADPVRGKILAALLAGPCALDYTKLKTQDHFWSDPPADELLQRHRLHSHRSKSNASSRRPGLEQTPPPLLQTSSSESTERNSTFREYVESLHQNSKISLLYGKNNVVVQPEEAGSIPGYFSLHKAENRITIKWTPNELMQGEDPDADVLGDLEGLDHSVTGSITKLNTSSRDSESYWNFAISVDMKDIVYLHCHHQADRGGRLVLVGQDGVQWPPIVFPPGGHLISFLSCLENGLRPMGYLDPPLWSQKGKGKVFPRIRRKSQRRSESSSDSDDFTDFVFRVSLTSDSSNAVLTSQKADRRAGDLNLFQPITIAPATWRTSSRHFPVQPVTPSVSGSGISRSVVLSHGLNSDSRVALSCAPVQPGYVADVTSKSEPNGSSLRRAGGKHSGLFESSDEYVPHLDMYTWEQEHPRHYNQAPQSNGSSDCGAISAGTSLELLCATMRRQITSRAFHGWLAHCRHVRAVRDNLSSLVNQQVMQPDQVADASVGVTEEVWKTLCVDGKLSDLDALSRYVYFGGVRDEKLRPLVWLYLLGHYTPGSDEEERCRKDAESRRKYEEIRSLDLEIKEKYGENTLPSKDKRLSSSYCGSSWSSNYVPAPYLRQQSSSSDVFLPPVDSMKVDKFEMVENWRRSMKKHRSAAEKRRRMLKRTKSDDSHIPYSSVSTATSVEDYSSMSIKSFSFDDEHYDVLKTVAEESERSSTSEIRTNSLEEGTAAEVHCNQRSTTPGSRQRGIEPNNNELNASSTVDKQIESIFSKVDSSNPIVLNLAQIEKDVNRCDRNHEYFSHHSNLAKLSNVMSCFVWEHPDVGYVQGMCDLAAPLLVLLDDESLVFACFVKLMKKVTFQKGDGMDNRLSNLRLLIQALDTELFEHLHKKNDQIPFFFCYRWFLLEFKRELAYGDDLYTVWESSWAAVSCSTPDFGLFFALAMLEHYRDVIMENDMDFPAIVKFFNEMAEKHDASRLLELSRRLVSEVQQMIQK